MKRNCCVIKRALGRYNFFYKNNILCPSFHLLMFRMLPHILSNSIPRGSKDRKWNMKDNRSMGIKINSLTFYSESCLQWRNLTQSSKLSKWKIKFCSSLFMFLWNTWLSEWFFLAEFSILWWIKWNRRITLADEDAWLIRN